MVPSTIFNRKSTRIRRKYCLLFSVFALLMLFFPFQSGHAQQASLTVTIDKSQWFCSDPWYAGSPDIYFRVSIGANEFSTRDNQIKLGFSPFDVNKEFTAVVDFSSGNIPIKIEQMDADGALTFDDDSCRIHDDQQDITFSLTGDPSSGTCSFAGSVAGACGQQISGRGQFRFTVTLQPPPVLPDLYARCIHYPIWPQPGESVELSVAALDGDLDLQNVDQLEIWYNSTAAPAAEIMNTSLLSLTPPALTEGTFNYGCKISNEGQEVWTGWRTVTVGEPNLPPQYANRVPILYTGPLDSRLDFVFYPDSDTFNNHLDEQFKSSIYNMIVGGMFTNKVYLENHRKMNFWIAMENGKAGDGNGKCDIQVDPRTWEDASGVLHNDEDLRDCARSNRHVFSARADADEIIIHEIGHAPFGLADEYCCDGGYFQTSTAPNLYRSIKTIPLGTSESLGCGDDASNVGRTAGDCRTFDEDIRWWFDEAWWTSDPLTNDIMVDATLTHNALDNRRINWVFERCDSALC